MVKITLTEEQARWLWQRLRVDWDEEINYQQSNGEHDTTYLEDLFDVFVACLGEPKSLIEAMVNKEIVEGMRKELEELKVKDN